ncbi:hypothetical protein EMIHUDRAFT_206956 [Emiliania huxleyi CCMP1516]|uniref:Glycoside hydrolase family 13 N-terminal domain-containing protein n=2 Tax=Emiliania huxleyi TaxID=2903 RepID=A0A0D3JKB6_EMIH1|nr:hypothetical protein EMIHUDRAFT_206956 [Emiliania huxleyi CCMP1516]EOD23951.1 hypothetical protein EMIHUDRAFT_206956 [Emiliania huxleyi CCMP1516]|eukprot:XP_005776380.1 hypothetical protein EMIHUDRAFT_206956 [Emiliania huxleyi CCMP1516]
MRNRPYPVLKCSILLAAHDRYSPHELYSTDGTEAGFKAGDSRLSGNENMWRGDQFEPATRRRERSLNFKPNKATGEEGFLGLAANAETALQTVKDKVLAEEVAGEALDSLCAEGGVGGGDGQCHPSEGSAEGLRHFCVERGLRHFGLHRDAVGWRFREWAPSAAAASLVGDFNGWDVTAHPCEEVGGGVWEALVRDDDTTLLAPLRVGARFKVQQDPSSYEVCALVPRSLGGFAWQHARPSRPPGSLRVYEVHVGIATAREEEHGYYASFGYQAGTFVSPQRLTVAASVHQALVDAAHGRGLLVLGEMVLAHSALVRREGLPQHAGGGPYFLPGEAGHHPGWGSRLFDYSRTEVLRLLLATIAHFAEAYRLDGFRLDAASTVLYRHRCLGLSPAHFCGARYEVASRCGLTFVMLANLLAKRALQPPLLTVAEESSGYPGLCAPTHAWGAGFDYRMAMGIPDLWGRELALAHAPADAPLPVCDERRLAYAECHDQSLVGDQALAFRLMGAAMYDGMSAGAPPSPAVARGVALHKVSRLLTYALAADAYLNFVGNEFGHPEFLADDPGLRYAQLLAFDRAMHAAEASLRWLSSPPPTRGDEARRSPRPSP